MYSYRPKVALWGRTVPDLSFRASANITYCSNELSGRDILKANLKNNFNTSESTAINKDQRFYINIEENVTIKQVQNFRSICV